MIAKIHFKTQNCRRWPGKRLQLLVWLLGAISAVCFAEPARVQSLTQGIPVYFEPNVGQFDPQVRFIARGAKYQAWITDQEMILVFTKQVDSPDRRGRLPREPKLSNPPQVEREQVRIRFGSLKPKAATGLDKLASYSNYFIGNDSSKWRSNVPNFARVMLEEVYPGIDAVFYGKDREIEYDFIVKPGADPRLITLNFDGPQKPRIDMRGDVSLQTRFGKLTHHAPLAFQGEKTLQASAKLDGHRVGFKLGPYDRSRPLTIDPTLEYSTFLGSSGGDLGNAIAVDSFGNAYVTGASSSGVGVPTTPGAFDTSANGSQDAFVAKLNAFGTGLVYSTYIGGTGLDQALGIAVGASGDAYIAGYTDSADFPTTAGAFDISYNGGDPYFGDGFVVKLNATGSALVYSTYLGGSGNDAAHGIAVDAAGNAYITGYTNSVTFPTTAGAFRSVFSGGHVQQCGGECPDAFVTKLNPAGTNLVYSTFLGGAGYYDTAYAIAVDALGNAYVTGDTYSANFPTSAGAFDTSFNGSDDAFVTKLNPAGSGLVYSTYLGGTFSDYATAIAVDSSGNAHVTGITSSPNFPTISGAFDTSYHGQGDAFVTKLNADGSGLIYSTFLGGDGADTGYGIGVDASGYAYITGITGFTGNFPTTPGALDTSFNGGTYDGFFARLNSDGSALTYSTFLGSSGWDQGSGIAVDASGNAWVTGQGANGFPTTPGAFNRTSNGYNDAFIAKISPATPPDTTPPEITPKVNPTPNAMGWNNSDVTVTWTVSDPESGIASSSGCGTVTISANTLGTVFTCSATNGVGLQNSASVTIKLDKTAPSVIPSEAPVPNAAGWNNSDVTLGWTFADSESGIASSSGCAPATVTTNTAGTTFTCVVTNGAGLVTSSPVMVRLDKTPPVAVSLSAAPNPAAIGTSISLTANFTDGGPGGLALAEYSIDGGVTFASLGSVSGTSATVIGSLGPFATPQVLNVCVRATDVASNQSPLNCTLVAIYDASGGFATGQGTFLSPPSALVGSTASGKAQFAFESKYLQGTTVPDGTTKFKFNAGNFDFGSTSYDWLVVAGARAQFKGSGTIKGRSGVFDFIVTAIDGDLRGGGGQDKFRIRITARPGGVVYDNQIGAPDSSDPTTVIDGSIVIHK